jgi:hypothetical protein
MRAENELSVVVKDNVVVFFMCNHGSMDFLGASCASSLKIDGSSNSTITVQTVPGSSEVVAIKVHNTEGGGVKRNTFLISITWEDGKMFVDLKKPFLSHPDRLLQVSIVGQVLMTTPEITFASIPAGMEVTDPNYCIVEDANLLFRYAVGKVSFADLEAAVMLDKRDQLERNLAQAESVVEGLRTKLAEQRVEHEKNVEGLLSTITEIEDVLAKTKMRLETEGRERMRFGSLLEKANDEIHKSHMHFDRIKDILNNQGYFRTFWGFLRFVKCQKIQAYLSKYSDLLT